LIFLLLTTRFDDFDEAIDEAIEEDLQDSEGESQPQCPHGHGLPWSFSLSGCN